MKSRKDAQYRSRKARKPNADSLVAMQEARAIKRARFGTAQALFTDLEGTGGSHVH